MSDDLPNDDQLIHQELDAIAAGAEPAISPGTEPAITAQAMDWRMCAAGMVLIFDRVVAPNWQLDAGEKDAMSEGFTQVLSAFFPTTNLDPRLQACLAFGGVMLAITLKRTDLSTGKVQPLRVKPEPEKDAPAPN